MRHEPVWACRVLRTNPQFGGQAMLCETCWKEEAKVHFTILDGQGTRQVNSCLACARREPLSWLLVWGYARSPGEGGLLRIPESVPGCGTMVDEVPGIVATSIQECGCGCRIAVGATMPCGHEAALVSGTHFASHACHCGRELLIPLSSVVCTVCGESQATIVVATAETCLWSEQRRRLVGVDGDLRQGHATWGTFAIRN